jgi:membrane-bound lytic murein transglycosylase B
MKLSLKYFIIALLVNSTAQAESLDPGEVNRFVEYMARVYEFDGTALRDLFSHTQYSQKVITAMEKPAEALPWDKYRPIFMDAERIEQGRVFWEHNRAALQGAEDEYGVPAGIIVAIIGVETRYGRNTGNDRVMDALSTLAFNFPKRSDYFREELEQFLLLTREQGIDPLSIRGSYAGAMGVPQFMPSSFRNYAVDFDHDGKIDIWNDLEDAIGSVANYLKQHGWEKGRKIAVPGQVTGNKYVDLLGDNMQSGVAPDQLANYDVQPLEQLPSEEKVKLINLEKTNGNEFWLGLHNFYVITSYNHSQLYAMVVFQLFDEISSKYDSTPVASR